MRPRRRTGLIIGLALLIVLAQFAFFQPVRDRARRLIGSPAIAADSIAGRIRNSFKLLFSVSDLGKENAQLKVTLNEQTAEIARLKAVENENIELRQDLSFAQSRTDLKLTPVSVIAYSPFGSFQVLTINKGSRDGLKEEQAVVAQGFLVGKIKKVSDTTAEVWLLTNRNLLTPVQLTSSRTTGILKGGIRGLVIDNIPIDTKVEVGEQVVTSDLEGLYPSGIAVGRIEEIISRKEEIFLAARISTPINTASLSRVFVIQN